MTMEQGMLCAAHEQATVAAATGIDRCSAPISAGMNPCLSHGHRDAGAEESPIDALPWLWLGLVQVLLSKVCWTQQKPLQQLAITWLASLH